ncbi:MAG TPA: class I SAM-dependent methyltransferase [Candidatus Acidoferrales bacterium]|nr:class I SAM-dependent methyltransferase [Candidatus Acidoferrales bacterium]
MAATAQLNREVQAGADLAKAAAESRARHAICPLCGSLKTRRAIRDGASELRECADCDLFFVHPYPAIDRHHEHVQSGENPEIRILDCERRFQGEQLYYERHFASIAEECAGAESVLDVGCGTGHLLQLLSSQSRMRCAGIELNAQAAEFARRGTSCEVMEIPFEDFECGEKFDVITLINVFSHIPSFDALFDSFRRALKPGGKVILRTAEMAENVSRWNQAHWGIPDDLHFLGLRTLDFLCAKYGFVVLSHQRLPYEEELFRRSRWQQMGRSRLVNLVKYCGVRIPGMLPVLKRAYTALFGERIFLSFIVLTPLDASRNSPQESADRRQLTNTAKRFRRRECP